MQAKHPVVHDDDKHTVYILYKCTVQYNTNNQKHFYNKQRLSHTEIKNIVAMNILTTRLYEIL